MFTSRAWNTFFLLLLLLGGLISALILSTRGGELFPTWALSPTTGEMTGAGMFCFGAALFFMVIGGAGFFFTRNAEE